MKTYREEVIVKKVVQDTICNCCGKPAVFRDNSDYCSLHWYCEVKINWQNHGSFPGQQSGVSEYDICQTCFTEKVKPLFTLPPNARVYDSDSNSTTVTP
jgi:hypothetical protein